MIARLYTDALYSVLGQGRKFEAAHYARRLADLPGDWPPPQTSEPS